MKPKQICTMGILAVFSTLLNGCGQDAREGTALPEMRGPQVELKKVDARAVKANNEFGLDMLQRLSVKDSSANLLISPVSLYLSLSMAYNGAAGETQKAMARALHWGALPLETINSANAALRYNLQTAIPQNDPRIEMAIANSLWAQQNLDFDAAFLARNKQFYEAQVSSIDLSTPAAVTTMNDWVNKNTKGKINQIFLAPLDDYAGLVLLNAMYFNGKWQSQFKKNTTRDGDFFLDNGQTQTVSMMSREGQYSYGKGEDFAMVELPYGHGDLSCLLVLPDKGVGLWTLLPQLTTANIDEWLNEMSPSEGTVSIPRFKMEYQSQLNQELQAMGMTQAFDVGRADFSKMRPQRERDLYISEVRHKVVIEMNEEGSEAAAATSLSTNTTSVAPAGDEPFEFVANRPFFGAIRERSTGALLFLMIMRDPQ